MVGTVAGTNNNSQLFYHSKQKASVPFERPKRRYALTITSILFSIVSCCYFLFEFNFLLIPTNTGSRSGDSAKERSYERVLANEGDRDRLLAKQEAGALMHNENRSETQAVSQVKANYFLSNSRTQTADEVGTMNDVERQQTSRRSELDASTIRLHVSSANAHPPPPTQRVKEDEQEQEETQEQTVAARVPLAPEGEPWVQLSDVHPWPYTDSKPDLATAELETLRAQMSHAANEEVALLDIADTNATMNGTEVQIDTYEYQRSFNSSLTVYDYILKSPRYRRPQDADVLAQENSIWRTLIRHYRNAHLSVLLDTREHMAVCFISAVYTRNCLYLDESFEECVARVGYDALNTVLASRCRASPKWRELGVRLHGKDPSASMESIHSISVQGGANALASPAWIVFGKPSENTMPLYEKFTNFTPQHVVPAVKGLRHGRTVAAELCPRDRPRKVPYVEPSRRFVAPMGPPRKCHSRALHYPVAFGNPTSQMQDWLYPKLFDFHPVPMESFGLNLLNLNDEDFYQAMAAMSYFCMTHARGGWDCGRHYEVMGAGCVPYFYDINAAGPYILPQLPKKLLREVVARPYLKQFGHVRGAVGDTFDFDENNYVKKTVFNNRSRVWFYGVQHVIFDRSSFRRDWGWYWRTSRKLLSYTQRYLTTEAMAAYVLKVMGVEGARRVLIMRGETWDNLHQSIVTGLDGLGVEMTIFNLPRDRGAYNCIGYAEDSVPSHNDMSTRRGMWGRCCLHAKGVPWANKIRGQTHRYMLNVTDDLVREAQEGMFDALIYTSFDEPGLPPHFETFAKHVNYKVALMDNKDTHVADPRAGSEELAKHVYFFSRELRRSNC